MQTAANGSTISVTQWSNTVFIEIDDTAENLDPVFTVNFSHSGLSCEDRCVFRIGKKYGTSAIFPVPAYLFTVAGTIAVTAGSYSLTVTVTAATQPANYCPCDETETERAVIEEVMRLGTGGGTVNLQEKTVTPATVLQVITADAGYTGLSAVNVEAIPSNYADVDNVTAAAGDVLASKVIVNASGEEVTGTIQSKAAATYTPGANAQEIASGQYLSGKQTIAAVPTEEKTQIAGTSNVIVTPTSGKFLSKVTVQPTPSEAKTATLATSAGTVTPTSGKLLSSVSIPAITSSVLSGLDANFLAENIKDGVSLFGLAGTFAGASGSPCSSGSFTASSQPNYTVTGLTFKPQQVFISRSANLSGSWDIFSAVVYINGSRVVNLAISQNYGNYSTNGSSITLNADGFKWAGTSSTKINGTYYWVALG